MIFSYFRASASDVLDKTNNPANLGLTTSRSTTCQSNLQHASTSRVSTRSSAILSDGGSEKMITPVHKIRGLVKSLSQRPRNGTPTTPSRSPSCSITAPLAKKVHSETNKSVVPSQKALSQNNRKRTKPVKRKRDEKSVESPESLCKHQKVKTKGAAVVTHTLNPQKAEAKVPVLHSESSRLSLPLSGCSPLFPVLKLRKTTGGDNNYVAVTVFNSPKGDLRDVHGTEKPTDSSRAGVSSEKPPGTSQGNLSDHHTHDTRFKGKAHKGTMNCQTSPRLGNKLRLGIKLDETTSPVAIKHEHEETLVNVFTERTDLSHADNDTRTQMKQSNSIGVTNTSDLTLQSSSKAKRQFKPKKVCHNQDIRVGDIVWGKVHGHPWWPGRVLGILCDTSKDDGGYQIVKVAWYGSTTTSEISCRMLLTFQEHFKHLFKKQKPGAYRRAVREAQQDLEVGMMDTQVMPA